MSGWDRQTDKGGEREGGGRLMGEECGWGGVCTEGAMEGERGWMRVMEANGKGWTAWCMDITRMGLRGAGEGGWGGSTTLHSLTKDTEFLARHGPFLLPRWAGRRLQEDGWS